MAEDAEVHHGLAACDMPSSRARRDDIALLLVEADSLLEDRGRLVRSAHNAEDLRQIHQRLCVGGEEVALLYEGDRVARQPLGRFGFVSAREDFRPSSSARLFRSERRFGRDASRVSRASSSASSYRPCV
jgi:hypothetical protein